MDRWIALIVLASCAPAATPRPTAPTRAPSAIAPAHRIVSADGRDCVVRGGRLFCWTTDAPAPIARFEHTVSLSARGDANCAAREDGTIACFDPIRLVWNERGEQIWPGTTDVVRLATPCALRADRSVVCSSLPFAVRSAYFDAPWLDDVREWVDRIVVMPIDLPPVVDVAASSAHVCFALEDGRVACMHGGATPAMLDGLPAATRVFLGDGCGDPLCVLDADAHLTCIPLAAGVRDRVGIAIDDVADVSFCGCLGCIVSTHGEVACFGGRNHRAPFASPPRAIAGIDRVVEISVGPDHVCVLRDDEGVACFEP